MDLDRTLFRTEKYEEIIAELERRYPQLTKRSAQDYFVHPYLNDGDEKTYYHDVSQWLRDGGLDPCVVYDELRSTELADGRFEYEDVTSFIDMIRKYGELCILTFGEELYQAAKVSLCPSLAGIRVVTTLSPKAVYLHSHAHADDWMIDDKEIADMPSEVKFVRVLYDGKIIGAKSYPVCADLEELGNYIAAHIDKKS